MTVRRATEGDLALVCALLESYYAEWEIWQRDPAERVLEDLRQADFGFFVAEDGSVPAGCVLCRPLPAIEGAAECKRLFVVPEFRGQGIAGRLMEAMEAAAAKAGAGWVYLDSKAEFANALALYRRRGYEDCGRYNDNAQATVFLRKAITG